MGFFFKDTDDGVRGPNGRELDPRGRELSAPDQRFIRERRDNGYTGWLDQDGSPAACPTCHTMTCTATLTERCN